VLLLSRLDRGSFGRPSCVNIAGITDTVQEAKISDSTWDEKDKVKDDDSNASSGPVV